VSVVRVTTQKYLHALRGPDFSELDELNLSERINNLIVPLGTILVSHSVCALIA